MALPCGMGQPGMHWGISFLMPSLTLAFDGCGHIYASGKLNQQVIIACWDALKW